MQRITTSPLETPSPKTQADLAEEFEIAHSAERSFIKSTYRNAAWGSAAWLVLYTGSLLLPIAFYEYVEEIVEVVYGFGAIPVTLGFSAYFFECELEAKKAAYMNNGLFAPQKQEITPGTSAVDQGIVEHYKAI